MTPSEMEEAFRNCHRRLTAIEEILPTLTPRALLESASDDIRKVAEGVASNAVKAGHLGSVIGSHKAQLNELDLSVRALAQRLEQGGIP